MKSAILLLVLSLCSCVLPAQRIQCMGVENHRGFFYQLAPPGQKMFRPESDATSASYFFVSSWQLSLDGIATVLQKRYGNFTNRGVQQREFDTATFVCRPALHGNNNYQLIANDCGTEIAKAIAIDVFDSTSRAWKTKYGGRRIWATFIDAMWLHLRVDKAAAVELGLDRPNFYDCDGAIEWFEYFIPIKIIEQRKAKVHRNNFLLWIPH